MKTANCQFTFGSETYPVETCDVIEWRGEDCVVEDSEGKTWLMRYDAETSLYLFSDNCR